MAGDALYYGEIRQPETYAAALDTALRTHDADAAERGRALARTYTRGGPRAERTLAAYRDAAEP